MKVEKLKKESLLRAYIVLDNALFTMSQELNSYQTYLEQLQSRRILAKQARENVLKILKEKQSEPRL